MALNHWRREGLVAGHRGSPLVSGFFIALLAFLLLGTGVASASPAGRRTVQQLGSGIRQAMRQSALQFRLRSNHGAVSLPLTLPGDEFVARISPTDIRSSGYRAEYTDATGRHDDPTTVDLFAGAPAESASGDFVRLAMISRPNEETAEVRGLLRRSGVYYSLHSTSQNPEQLELEETDPAEVARIVKQCGTESAIQSTPSQSTTGGGAGSPDRLIDRVSADSVKQASIATEADFEYFQATGGVNPSNAEILAIMNDVSGIYQNQLGVTFSVVFQHTWTVSSDPYTTTDSNSLLSQFRTYWESNFAPTHSYNVAHLFTGRDLDSNIVGLAYLGSLCTSFRYGLSQRLGAPYDDALSAHEIGHNFDMEHDPCTASSVYIMCPFVIANATQFSPASISAAQSYITSLGTSCLTAVNGGGGGGGTDPTPHAPVLSSIGSKTIAEGSTLVVPLSATDADGDALTFSASPSLRGLSVSGSTLSYTPPVGTVPTGSASTIVTLTVTVTDTTARTASENVPITVQAFHSPPTISLPGAISATAGQLISFAPSIRSADGTPFIVTLSPLPKGAFVDPATGVVHWRPAGNQTGDLTLTLTATDARGAVSQAITTIHVSGASNVPPLPFPPAALDFDGSGHGDLTVYRPSTGTWYHRNAALGSTSDSQAPYGLFGDVPVPGDYDGDGIFDRAVFRPGAAPAFYLQLSNSGYELSMPLGDASSIPVPADYDGDGRTDPAVYSPSTGTWTYRSSATAQLVTISSFGAPGDIPLACDYFGTGSAALVLFRPSFHQWYVRPTDGSRSDETVTLGDEDTIPLVGDFTGNGRCELMAFEPATAHWHSSAGTDAFFGLAGDVPAPLDADGTGSLQLAVLRPTNVSWYVRHTDGTVTEQQYGLSDDLVPAAERTFSAFRGAWGSRVERDSGSAHLAQVYDRKKKQLATVRISGALTQAGVTIPVGVKRIVGDYDRDGQDDIATVSGAQWTITLATGAVRTLVFGQAGDIPVAGDFDGDGASDVAVFRPNRGDGFGAFYVARSRDGAIVTYPVGDPFSIPAPADRNGDGRTDPIVWESRTGTWYGLDARSGAPLPPISWGLPGDRPLTADVDGDGRGDLLVWRPGNGTFYVYSSSGAPSVVPWGLSGDTPMLLSFLQTRAADLAVFRPSTGSFFVRTVAGASAVLGEKLDRKRAQLIVMQPAAPVP